MNGNTRYLFDYSLLDFLMKTSKEKNNLFKDKEKKR